MKNIADIVDATFDGFGLHFKRQNPQNILKKSFPIFILLFYLA